MADTMTNRYYTVDVAAASVSIPPSTIRRWITEGRLTHLLTNGVLYVTLGEVQQLADLRDTHGRLPVKRLPIRLE